MAEGAAPFASLEGKLALVTGASKGIGRAIAQELARGGAEVVIGYRSGKDEAEQLASELGARARRREEARRGGGRRRRARQQRRPHAGRTARAHVGRRLADGDRDQPQLRLLHMPGCYAADDEEARRLDRQRQLRRRGARKLG